MAAASYAAVASTRPRIRRDVLYTETPDGVLFHNADGGFRLTAKAAYRFATLIVPHLNGDHTVAELCEGLGDPQRTMVGELVKTLYERDFARPVPTPGTAEPEPALPAEVAQRYAPQIAYADHYADRPTARFHAFRTTRVAVLGEDPVARWCAISLIRNGCATIAVSADADSTAQTDSWPNLAAVASEAAEAAAEGCPVELRHLAPSSHPYSWADLDGYEMVVVTGADAPARLLPLLRAGVPDGRTLLPAWTFGADQVVGPAMRSGTRGCWVCAALRLGPRSVPGAAADLWSSLVVPLAEAGPAVPGRPQAAMIGNTLGYEVFRLASGALPAETEGAVLLQDLQSLDVTAEPLFTHPRCPYCRDEGGGHDEALAPVDLHAAGNTGAVALPTLATAREADELVAELDRRSVLVRPRAGVFTRYADDPLTQLPLKLSVVELPLGHGRSRSVAAFDIHHVAAARMRALDAAAAVYAEHVVPATTVWSGEGARGCGLDMVPAARLSTASGAADSSALGPRLRAVSLVTKECALVPAGAVRPFGPHNADGLFERSSAGTGVGSSRVDAAARGLLSALAHDALLRTVRGSAGAVELPRPDGAEQLDGAEGDGELTFLFRCAERLGRTLELLDLGEAERTGVHVLLARSEDRWAVGSDLDRRAAAVTAMRDLLGTLQYEGDEAAPATEYGADTGDPLLRDLDARALAVAGTAPGLQQTVSSVDWSQVLDRLRAAGRDAFFVPTGSADLASVGLHAVRVLLTSTPEARHAG
ncbi:TOMM precursor leader peptide-binding protein [Streptomyces sp. NPDC006879]|uniref:TOMM precursor leader peptide-binding protein n=1 Tax=Streptomyces sp. NPDC006879 TaxID=3364767 RepID=UPI00368C217C